MPAAASTAASACGLRNAARRRIAQPPRSPPRYSRRFAFRCEAKISRQPPSAPSVSASDPRAKRHNRIAIGRIIDHAQARAARHARRRAVLPPSIRSTRRTKLDREAAQHAVADQGSATSSPSRVCRQRQLGAQRGRPNRSGARSPPARPSGAPIWSCWRLTTTVDFATSGPKAPGSKRSNKPGADLGAVAIANCHAGQDAGGAVRAAKLERRETPFRVIRHAALALSRSHRPEGFSRRAA